MNDLSKQEELVEDYLSRGDTDNAVKLLFDLIVHCAKSKDFSKAEALRKKLIAANSLALTEIIQSAEVIESEKVASIDQQHHKVWQDLYSGLSPEVGTALYHSMKEVVLSPNQAIIEQKRPNSKLFFIDHGSLKVVFRQLNQLTFIKSLDPGDTAGEDTFFPISLCTTSIITTSGVKLRYLNRQNFDALSEKFPGFSDILASFCKKKQHDDIAGILNQKAMERRQHKRFETTGKVITQLLNSDGRPLSSPFSGQIEDISRGGASFQIKCSKESTARMLLGRPNQLKIGVQLGNEIKTIQTSSLIVCAINLNFNDYSVHVRFSELLSNQQMIDLNLSI